MAGLITVDWTSSATCNSLFRVVFRKGGTTEDVVVNSLSFFFFLVFFFFLWFFSVLEVRSTVVADY